ncbi:MAG TPA: bifunctional phosphopantothenoylcysteine decarboxylase/phosphopantothenate--cysteine ligase CoaBC [Candidatus Cloacimonadota bacterium]|nr:bifunctional phosphopantothenoylcysteine decarboxylase/phosphopantothenate--cysteine ligase CoaBC [Candidatus Cloacimonadota bacterium]
MKTTGKILLCVTGGIAAYKAIELSSMLNKAGYEVKTLLSPSAMKFVGPVNFAAITHNSVHYSLWEDADPIPHINLADWADMMVVAPATANSIAKAAYGLADDLLGSTLLAHQKPVLWVPAMNVHMFENPVTQKNLNILREAGHHVLSPASGMLACGYEGKGKYPPNIEIMHAISCYLVYGEDLSGIKAMVTAGGTVERIDPMRTISNRSSGKMGVAIARALTFRGAEVTLIYGAISVELPHILSESVKAESVDEMYSAVMQRAPQMDWIIKCAAVSDFKPLNAEEHKIKKGDTLRLELVATKDILADLGKHKKPGQKLIGFAAETDDLIANAATKLKAKNLDLIVANLLDNAASDTNEITILSAQNANSITPIKGTKAELAHIIIDRVKAL